MRFVSHMSVVAMVLGLTLPQSASAETIAELFAMAPERQGEIFFVQDAGDYTLVPALNELWKLDGDGQVINRTTVVVGPTVADFAWNNGERYTLDLSQELDVEFKETTVPLVEQINELLSGSLQTPFAGLPKGARFTPLYQIASSTGIILGRWEILNGAIVLERPNQPTQNVEITGLLTHMKPIGVSK